MALVAGCVFTQRNRTHRSPPSARGPPCWTMGRVGLLLVDRPPCSAFPCAAPVHPYYNHRRALPPAIARRRRDFRCLSLWRGQGKTWTPRNFVPGGHETAGHRRVGGHSAGPPRRIGCRRLRWIVLAGSCGRPAAITFALSYAGPRLMGRFGRLVRTGKPPGGPLLVFRPWPPAPNRVFFLPSTTSRLHTHRTSAGPGNVSGPPQP